MQIYSNYPDMWYYSDGILCDMQLGTRCLQACTYSRTVEIYMHYANLVTSTLHICTSEQHYCQFANQILAIIFNCAFFLNTQSIQTTNLKAGFCVLKPSPKPRLLSTLLSTNFYPIYRSISITVSILPLLCVC